MCERGLEWVGVDEISQDWVGVSQNGSEWIGDTIQQKVFF